MPSTVANWDALDDVFTEDALIDYTAMHGFKGDLPTAKRFLDDASPKFTGGYHMVATSKVTIDGDVAAGQRHLSQPRGERPRWGTDPRDLLRPLVSRSLRAHVGGLADQGAGDGAVLYHNVPAAFAFLQAEHDADCACIQGLLADRAGEDGPEPGGGR